MEGALRASVAGLEQIDQARQRQGWNRQSIAWAEAALTSVATLKQFWRRERISRETFIRICQAVGRLDWESIAEPTKIPSKPQPRVDWGEAPEPSFFCGRGTELETLTRWIIADRVKLVALLGMGGMGKTTLTVKLTEHLATEFECVIWRSLRHAPPLERLLADLLRFFVASDLAPVKLGELTVEEAQGSLSLVTACLSYLRSHRCLVVLDNAESILADTDRPITGAYCAGYEGYGEWLRRMGEERHQSCLILTSREQPTEMALLEGDKVRSLHLRGLLPNDGQQILERSGAIATSAHQSQVIVNHYAGNPLALKIAAAGIRDLLKGNVVEFLNLLQQGKLVFGDIRDLLDRHFSRLPDWGREVMYWLAIAREPISLEELSLDLLTAESRSQLTATLDALKRRSLLEISPGGFTLQPAVMEYVTNQLIEGIDTEIRVWVAGKANQEMDGHSATLPLLQRHALVKATAKDYIREAQMHLIVEPLVERLRSVYDNYHDVKAAIAQLVPAFQGKPAIKTGYIAGNILNLLGYLQADLNGYDFSHLTIWQADLRRTVLHGVNFTGSDLSHSAFTETFSNVLSVAFSPDGKTLAKSDEQGWISIWQVETGKQLLALRSRSSWVFSVAFNHNGTLLASGGLDRTIELWDLETGQCRQMLQMHQGGISAVAFGQIPCPAGGSREILASGSADQSIRLIDPHTGECLHCLEGHQGIVRAIAFSPDGAILASASLDHTIKLWDVATGACLKTLTDTVAIYAIAFVEVNAGNVPQGQQGKKASIPCTLVSAGDDGAIKQWDLTTGICAQVLTGHSDRIWSLTANQTSNILVSGGDDKTLRIWDVATGQCLKTLQGHRNRIWSVALSPDGQTLASGSNDRTVRLWNVNNGQCLRCLQGYDNGTTPIAFTTPTTLVTFSADQTIRIWETTTGHCLKTLRLPTKAAMQAALSPDGRTVASGSLDHTIRICALDGDNVRSLGGHTAWVRTVAFNANGSLLASASGDQTAKIWDVVSGICLQTLAGHTNPLQSVAFSPQGDLLASGSWDWTVKLWQVDNGTCLHTLQGHTDQIRGLSFTPDGRMVISSSLDSTLRWWNVATGECLKVLDEHRGEITAIACSADGQLLASGSQDGTIRLWSLSTGTCLKVLPLQTGYCGALVFSPDQRFLANGGEGGTCTLWDQQTGEMIITLQVPRPYEGMIITDASGLTNAQTAHLKILGAIDESGKHGQERDL